MNHRLSVRRKSVYVTLSKNCVINRKTGRAGVFVDFEGHVEDAKVKKTLDALDKHCDKVVVLGSFTMSDLIE